MLTRWFLFFWLIDVRLCALEGLVDFTRLDGRWPDLEFLLDIMTHDADPAVRHSLVRMLCENPPFQRNVSTPEKHRLDKEDLVHKLWLAFKYVIDEDWKLNFKIRGICFYRYLWFCSGSMSHDSKMRCSLVDLYFMLYGRRQPTCLPTSDVVASLYKPQKESEVCIGITKSCQIMVY